MTPERDTTRALMMAKPKANNYFHVRVYTDDASKLEIFRDKKYPSTRQQIIDGLKRAIDLIEKIDAPKIESSVS